MQRTRSSIKNLIVALIGQIFGLIVSYLARIVFLRYLDAEYLGLNGLFTNLLTMLALVELGVGPAMVFSLYKPLAENDTEKVKSLMQLYKRAYMLIGLLIFALGLAFTPFYPALINDLPDIPRLNLIYLLFVANTAVSYLYSYKRSLIITDQKRYIATIYRYGFYILLNVGQILILVLTRNYILFLLLQVFSTWLENYLVSRKADRMYPFLSEKNVRKVDPQTVTGIKKNVGAMLFHKIGEIFVTASNNIFMAKFVNLTAVGIFSNYELVTNAIKMVTSQIFQSVVASVGNLNASETEADREKLYRTFQATNFVGFWVFAFCAVALLVLLNPFIALSFGEDLIFELPVVILIVITFYISGMRRAILTYRDAAGLYWIDRYKPLAESVIKVATTIPLALKMGVAGIFLGTIISTLTTCFWVEPYVLYRYVLRQKLSAYFRKYFEYTLIGVIACLITVWITGFVPQSGWSGLLIKGLLCAVIPNAIFIIFFYRTPEFQYLVEKLSGVFRSLKSRFSAADHQ